MGKLIGWATSKTVWGALALAASQVPALAAYSPLLHVAGTALAGVGVADKLDRIKTAITDAPTQ